MDGIYDVEHRKPKRAAWCPLYWNGQKTLTSYSLFTTSTRHTCSLEGIGYGDYVEGNYCDVCMSMGINMGYLLPNGRREKDGCFGCRDCNWMICSDCVLSEPIINTDSLCRLTCGSKSLRSRKGGVLCLDTYEPQNPEFAFKLLFKRGTENTVVLWNQGDNFHESGEFVNMKQEYSIIAADVLPLHYIISETKAPISLILSVIKSYPEACSYMAHKKFPVFSAIERKQPETVIIAMMEAFPEVYSIVV